MIIQRPCEQMPAQTIQPGPFGWRGSSRVVDYPNHGRALVYLMNALLSFARHEEGIAEAELAVSLDPNSAIAHSALGMARAWGGQPREAMAPLQTAMRLSPFDPRMPAWRSTMARAHYLVGDYPAAVSEARQTLNASPNHRPSHITLIAALGTGDLCRANGDARDAPEAAVRRTAIEPVSRQHQFRFGARCFRGASFRWEWPSLWNDPVTTLISSFNPHRTWR
jgi:tetratricopeptide (TPR) repeat protein